MDHQIKCAIAVSESAKEKVLLLERLFVLPNPQELWASVDIHHRKTLLKLMLEHRLEYERVKGLQR